MNQFNDATYDLVCDENELLRNLLKEAVGSIEKAIVPMDNDVWYCVMPSILADSGWYRRALRVLK